MTESSVHYYVAYEDRGWQLGPDPHCGFYVPAVAGTEVRAGAGCMLPVNRLHPLLCVREFDKYCTDVPLVFWETSPIGEVKEVGDCGRCAVSAYRLVRPVERNDPEFECQALLALFADYEILAGYGQDIVEQFDPQRDHEVLVEFICERWSCGCMYGFQFAEAAINRIDPVRGHSVLTKVVLSSEYGVWDKVAALRVMHPHLGHALFVQCTLHEHAEVRRAAVVRLDRQLDHTLLLSLADDADADVRAAVACRIDPVRGQKVRWGIVRALAKNDHSHDLSAVLETMSPLKDRLLLEELSCDTHLSGIVRDMFVRKLDVRYSFPVLKQLMEEEEVCRAAAASLYSSR